MLVSFLFCLLLIIQRRCPFYFVIVFLCNIFSFTLFVFTFVKLYILYVSLKKFVTVVTICTINLIKKKLKESMFFKAYSMPGATFSYIHPLPPLVSLTQPSPVAELSLPEQISISVGWKPSISGTKPNMQSKFKSVAHTLYKRSIRVVFIERFE